MERNRLSFRVMKNLDSYRDYDYEKWDKLYLEICGDEVCGILKDLKQAIEDFGLDKESIVTIPFPGEFYNANEEYHGDKTV